MRILAFSDLHDDEYAMEKLADIKKGFDISIVAGDIGTNRSFAEEFADKFMDAIVIPGNNEPRFVIEVLEKMPNYLHGKKKRVDSLEFAGFGFSNPTPFSTPNELSEEEIEKEMKKLELKGGEVLITHAPPYGVLDEIKGNNVGSMAIRNIIEEKKPLLAISGHLHEKKGVSKIGNTIVVRLSSAESGWYAEINIKNSKIDVSFNRIR